MSNNQPSKQLSVADLRKSREEVARNPSGTPAVPPAGPQRRLTEDQSPMITNTDRGLDLRFDAADWRRWLFVGGGLSAILMVLKFGILPHLSSFTGSGQLHRDPNLRTLRFMLDIAIDAHRGGHTDTDDFKTGDLAIFVTDRKGTGEVEARDAWRSMYVIEPGGIIRSSGRDRKPNTPDDITVDVMRFTYAGPVEPTAGQMKEIESAWPVEFHGRFPIASQ